MSGKEFLVKRPCHTSITKWTFLEELILVQLLHGQLVSDNNIDVGFIHMQYLEFVDDKDVLPKTVKQITGKAVSYLNENEVFKTLLTEQIRLNWFR